jgi:hypothetical protein
MDILSICQKNAVLNLPLSFQSPLEITRAQSSKPYLQWIKVWIVFNAVETNVDETMRFSNLKGTCKEKISEKGVGRENKPSGIMRSIARQINKFNKLEIFKMKKTLV